MRRAHPPAINIRWTPPLVLALGLVVLHVFRLVTGAFWPDGLQLAVMLRPFQYTDGASWLGVVGHALAHQDWEHVLFNVFFLVAFASIVRRATRGAESVWITILLAGIVGGALGQWVWWTVEAALLGTDLAFQSAVGISGGVSGLFAAAVVLGGGWRKARLAGVFWLGLNLVFAIVNPQIAWAAHVAGYMAGMLVMTRVRT